MQIVYNLHIVETCNYRCEFCFAKWNENGDLPLLYKNKDAVEKLFKELAQKDVIGNLLGENVRGVRINFAGGEPLMLGDTFTSIVKLAKDMGFETSLITNGSLFGHYPRVVQYLDMVGISIDSMDGATCKAMGRCSKNGDYISEDKITSLVSQIKHINPGIKLKFNTVVNRHNCRSDIAERLQALKPDRLKILRQLPFNGKGGISDEDFDMFLRTNKDAVRADNAVIENTEDITESYLMIDPYGRFFQNGNEAIQGYVYSDPIHKVGLKRALSQISFNKERFLSRYKEDTTFGKITISGYAGAGKSFVGKMLAEKFGYEFMSVGNIARRIAENEYGMSINEFQDKCKNNPQLDYEINYKFGERCNNAENVVADFRLGFHFVKNSFNILLTVSDDVAFERLSNADRGKEKTDIESIRKRNHDMRERFIERFGVDFADKNNYHIVIDTSKKTPEETLSLIMEAVTKQVKKVG